MSVVGSSAFNDRLLNVAQASAGKAEWIEKAQFTCAEQALSDASDRRIVPHG